MTDIRLSHPWLLYLLPVSGALFAYLYAYHGGLSSRGNNLVIDQGNGGEEKSRCGLFHLQARYDSTIFTNNAIIEKVLLGMIGTEPSYKVDFILPMSVWHALYSSEIIISAGFSSVFGTPLAGTLFGLEVLAIGKVRTEAIFPSFFAALFANFMTESYGVSHLHYQMGVIPEWSMLLFFKKLYIRK
ncbi:hypothetical protein EfmJHP36_22730 [Enterococcus faecium]|nr:hypothetical protein EfmJHP36_22730 [Enterococcus faecium]